MSDTCKEILNTALVCPSTEPNEKNRKASFESNSSLLYGVESSLLSLDSSFQAKTSETLFLPRSILLHTPSTSSNSLFKKSLPLASASARKRTERKLSCSKKKVNIKDDPTQAAEKCHSDNINLFSFEECVGYEQNTSYSNLIDVSSPESNSHSTKRSEINPSQTSDLNTGLLSLGVAIGHHQNILSDEIANSNMTNLISKINKNLPLNVKNSQLTVTGTGTTQEEKILNKDEQGFICYNQSAELSLSKAESVECDDQNIPCIDLTSDNSVKLILEVEGNKPTTSKTGHRSLQDSTRNERLTPIDMPFRKNNFNENKQMLMSSKLNLKLPASEKDEIIPCIHEDNLPDIISNHKETPCSQSSKIQMNAKQNLLMTTVTETLPNYSHFKDRQNKQLLVPCFHNARSCACEKDKLQLVIQDQKVAVVDLTDDNATNNISSIEENIPSVHGKMESIQVNIKENQLTTTVTDDTLSKDTVFKCNKKVLLEPCKQNDSVGHVQPVQLGHNITGNSTDAVFDAKETLPFLNSQIENCQISTRQDQFTATVKDTSLTDNIFKSDENKEISVPCQQNLGICTPKRSEVQSVVWDLIPCVDLTDESSPNIVSEEMEKQRHLCTKIENPIVNVKNNHCERNTFLSDTDEVSSFTEKEINPFSDIKKNATKCLEQRPTSGLEIKELHLNSPRNNTCKFSAAPGDAVILKEYPFNQNEVECYCRILGLMPSHKQLSKCFKYLELKTSSILTKKVNLFKKSDNTKKIKSHMDSSLNNIEGIAQKTVCNNSDKKSEMCGKDINEIVNDRGILLRDPNLSGRSSVFSSGESNFFNLTENKLEDVDWNSSKLEESISNTSDISTTLSSENLNNLVSSGKELSHSIANNSFESKSVSNVEIFHQCKNNANFNLGKEHIFNESYSLHGAQEQIMPSPSFTVSPNVETDPNVDFSAGQNISDSVFKINVSTLRRILEVAENLPTSTTNNESNKNVFGYDRTQTSSVEENNSKHKFKNIDALNDTTVTSTSEVNTMIWQNDSEHESLEDMYIDNDPTDYIDSSEASDYKEMETEIPQYENRTKIKQHKRLLNLINDCVDNDPVNYTSNDCMNETSDLKQKDEMHEIPGYKSKRKKITEHNSLPRLDDDCIDNNPVFSDSDVKGKHQEGSKHENFHIESFHADRSETVIFKDKDKEEDLKKSREKSTCTKIMNQNSLSNTEEIINKRLLTDCFVVLDKIPIENPSTSDKNSIKTKKNSKHFNKSDCHGKRSKIDFKLQGAKKKTKKIAPIEKDKTKTKKSSKFKAKFEDFKNTVKLKQKKKKEKMKTTSNSSDLHLFHESIKKSNETSKENCQKTDNSTKKTKRFYKHSVTKKGSFLTDSETDFLKDFKIPKKKKTEVSEKHASVPLKNVHSTVQSPVIDVQSRFVSPYVNKCDNYKFYKNKKFHHKGFSSAQFSNSSCVPSKDKMKNVFITHSANFHSSQTNIQSKEATVPTIPPGLLRNKFLSNINLPLPNSPSHQFHLTTNNFPSEKSNVIIQSIISAQSNNSVKENNSMSPFSDSVHTSWNSNQLSSLNHFCKEPDNFVTPPSDTTRDSFSTFASIPRVSSTYHSTPNSIPRTPTFDFHSDKQIRCSTDSEGFNSFSAPTSSIPILSKTPIKHFITCLVPQYLKSSVGHEAIETPNVCLLMLEWSVDLLLEQQKCHDPSPISTALKEVANSYSTLEDHYNTYFPLMLLDTWHRIYVSWIDLNRYEPYYCDITSYSVKNTFVSVECQTLLNYSLTHRCMFPEEGSILMVKYHTESIFSIEILGYVTSVKTRSFNPVTDSKFCNFKLPKDGNFKVLKAVTISFIGAYHSDNIVKTSPIRVHVLCNVISALKQNDALLNISKSFLLRSILNPVDEFLSFTLPPQNSSEGEVQECVRNITEGIMSPHPIPQLTIVRATPQSNRLNIIPLIIENMKNVCNAKVLLCVRTVSALCDIAANICSYDSLKLVIINKKKDTGSQLQKYLLDELINFECEKNSLQDSPEVDDTHAENDSVIRAKKQILKDCDVVLSLIRNSHNELMESAFSETESISQVCCIIDEANKCTEPETLIPLLHGLSKLILIGNPDDPAKVISKTARSFHYNRSLFHRAYAIDLITK